MKLNKVNPDTPYLLRVDPSDRAIGAAMEQFEDDGPTTEDALGRLRRPVAFCYRKLTSGQARTWTPR